MSLLSPSESHAFQAFLTSIDPFTDSVAPEWSMYAHDIPDEYEIPQAQGKEALAKATKDLMSLDADRWSTTQSNSPIIGSATGNHQIQSQHQYTQINHQQHQQKNQQLSGEHQSHRQHSFPFLTNSNKQQQSQQTLQNNHQHSQHPQLHPISVPPIHPLSPSSLCSTSPNTSIPPSSTNTSFPFSTPALQTYSSTSTSPQSASVSISPSLVPSRSPPSLNARNLNHHRSNGLHIPIASPSSTTHTNHRRPRPSPRPQLHPYATAASGSGAGSNSIRQPQKVNVQQQSGQHPVTSSPSSSSTLDGKFMRPLHGQPISSHSDVNLHCSQIQHHHATNNSHAPPKPTLLSPSQKKANHIQSEQKRRANIRRGYEALCDAVPALREAIRSEEEEMEQAALLAAAANDGQTIKSTKRRARKKIEVDGEKVDGRAGPRSENVVLSKSE